MRTLQQAADEIAAAAAALHDAVAQSGNVDYLRIESMLSSRLAQFTGNPTMPLTQAYTDAVGGDLLALERQMQSNIDPDYLQFTDPLHALLSQTMVDHAGDLDWYQTAQTPRPANGMTEAQSGSKHKPAAS